MDQVHLALETAVDAVTLAHYIRGVALLYATTNRGNPIGVRLKMLAGRPPRGPRADPWLTISAWLWAFYLAGVGAAAAWLLF